MNCAHSDSFEITPKIQLIDCSPISCLLLASRQTMRKMFECHLTRIETKGMRKPAVSHPLLCPGGQPSIAPRTLCNWQFWFWNNQTFLPENPNTTSFWTGPLVQRNRLMVSTLRLRITSCGCQRYSFLSCTSPSESPGREASVNSSMCQANPLRSLSLN